MTNYIVNSAFTLISGTDAANNFEIQTAAEISLFGNGGSDTMSGGGTVAGINLASLIGGDGNDVIHFTGGTITASKASINLGDGNDIFTAEITDAPEFSILGGQGNDTIVISGAAGMLMRSSRAIGNGGDDLLDVSLATGSAFWLAGGGGNDILRFSAVNVNAELISGTIAGGGGADTISANFTGAGISGIYFAGDDPSTLDAYDGADSIALTGAIGIEASTINAQGGNDTISIDAIGTGNLVNGNNANDALEISGLSQAARTTLAGGAGNDLITLNSFTGVGSGFLVQGGGDIDTITLSGGSLSNTAVSIIGGAGADIFNLKANGLTASGGATRRDGIGLFFYGATNESTALATDVFSGVGSSTLSGLDFGISAVSGFVATSVVNTGLGAEISGGIAIFTSTLSQAVTARTTILDTLAPTAGAAVLFSTTTHNGTNNNYLFVQGGAADDLVVNFANGQATALIAISGNYHVSFN